MGGNHFPCLLNKTIKRHYELASGKAFACHCLHLLEGVSGLSCFFWLFQNTVILLQRVREVSGNTEANGAEEPAVTRGDTYQTAWPARSVVNVSEAFKRQPSKVSGLILIAHSSATRNNLYDLILSVKLRLRKLNKGREIMIETDTFLRRTSKLPRADMQHIPWSETFKATSGPQTIITCFPGYTGGIKVQVVRGGFGGLTALLL